jgi:hypothetical protein
VATPKKVVECLGGVKILLKGIAWKIILKKELPMYLGSMILSKNDNWLINWWKKKDFAKIKFHLNGNIDDIACNLNLIQIHWILIQQFDWKIIFKKSYLCNLNSIQIQLKRN